MRIFLVLGLPPIRLSTIDYRLRLLFRPLPPTMTPMKLLIAPTYRWAVNHAKEQGFHPREWRYVHGVQSLRGWPRGTQVLLVGPWEDRPDAGELLAVMESYGYAFERVSA